ncbi:beta-glucosidase BglX [Polaribacter vadi]|uniref:beta-glucosidase BglX n=1 Tax=Polaribacter vadi TaxID=1774273 RepID=UPI0030ED909C|tara:strand:- start:3752 stop:6061 length:2310 start_codon:yes stop_codon:yes gene_type:complete
MRISTKISFIIFIIGIGFLSCHKIENTTENSSLNKEIERKVDSVLNLMTLEEKIGQTVQYSVGGTLTGPGSSSSSRDKHEKIKKGQVGSLLNVVSVARVREMQELVMENYRLKIPLIFAYDVIHGLKTIFPIPLGESASWDLDLMKQSAAIAAKESAASGLNWTFAPMIDVSRDARWGRIMEGAGEDPYLNSVIGVARIQGFQGDDLADNNTIAACAKHFAGYGFAEAGREYSAVTVGEFELHNMILPPFKAAAKAGVATFMNSFNDIDGIPATGHRELQRDILKGDWNWNGFIVSDWGSIGEMRAHGFAKDKKHAAEIALNAGSDMDMESYAYEASLATLLEEDKISLEHLNDAVKRILRIKFQLGLFDDPYKYCDEEKEKNDIYTPEHLAVARDAAKKSIVLLKNDHEILPVSKSVKSIAIIGPFGDNKNQPLGNWRGKGTYNSAVSLLEGVKAKVDENTKIYYEKGIDLLIPTVAPGERQFLHPLKINTENKDGIAKAVAAAKKAEIVLLAIGEDAYQTGEGRSQVNIGFAGLQNELLEAVYKVNKNIVLVLSNGRPMDLTRANEILPAILVTWQLGSESGNGIADVLFGDYNPSAKLPVSFPRNVGQEPLYYNQKNTGRPYHPKHVTYAGYTDEEKSPLFPFGFGLSYTTFSYNNIKVDKETISSEEKITLSVDVTNSGNIAGEEVVQLYIRDLVASIVRPVKELKGFEKISLNAGETKTVTFTIDKEVLQFYTINKKWEVEAGDFQLFVGGNSATKLVQKITVE